MNPTVHVALAGLILSFLPSPLAGQDGGPMKLVDFRDGAGGEWVVVNDGVMGGISSSDISLASDGVGVFEGVLSLENNGGFASVRTAVPSGALEGASKIVLRVRGDGNAYQLRLRQGRRFDGIAYAAPFRTEAGEWATVELPLASFAPTFRGYRPPNAPPLDPAQIGQFGIMLTDKQEGPFRLEIEWIGAE